MSQVCSEGKSVLWLRHVRIKVVEVTQLGGPEARIGICRVEAFVVFNVDEDIVLLGSGEKRLVVFEQFHGGLRDQDVVASLNGVQRYWVMGGVRGEYCDWTQSGRKSQAMRRQVNSLALPLGSASIASL